MNDSFIMAGRGVPEFPPVVYVPTTDGPDPALRAVQMHLTEDRRTALFVYSAVDRLYEAYGADVAWLVTNVEALQRIHDESPYDLLFLDRTPDLGASASEVTV